MSEENARMIDTHTHVTVSKVDMIKQCVRAVAIVSINSFIAALVIGGAWLALGWMRFYGLETGVVAQALPLEHVDYHNAVLNLTASAIDSYNSFFQGNSRFGSGLGLMAGSCFSLLCFKRSPRSAQMLAVMLAGAIVAGRFCLTFTSSPAPFLVSIIVGAIGFLAISWFAREPLPALPLLDKPSAAL
jgi:hypothetical protein